MLFKREIIEVDYEGFSLERPHESACMSSYVLSLSNEINLGRKRPAVVICPGGGYTAVSPRESEPVAMQFLAHGMNAFVLNYSVSPAPFPTALLELSTAVAYLRENAEKYNIEPNKIIICGFSAGGHLAASLGVFWKESFLQRFMELNCDENKPNGLILCYPVISGDESITHLPSKKALLGLYPDEDAIAMFSLENYVSTLTPPTFLWHTNDDVVVSVENSLLFAAALKQNDVPFELHIYPSGDHGLSLATEASAEYAGQINPACQNWLEMAVRFINGL